MSSHAQLRGHGGGFYYEVPEYAPPVYAPSYSAPGYYNNDDEAEGRTSG